MKTKAISSNLLNQHFEQLPEMYKVFLIIGFCTGCRVSELLELKFKDFTVTGITGDGKITENTMVYCKHFVLKKRSYAYRPEQQTKTIPLDIYTKFILPFFKKMRDKGKTANSYIFAVRDGMPISRMTVYRVFRRCYGSGYGTHFIRKTYAKNLYQNFLKQGHSSFAAAYKVKNELGHRYVETTASYIGIDEDDTDICKLDFLKDYKFLGENK